MSKSRATIGMDGLPLPILPPERDSRVWARLVRVMFYLPGFMGLLLIKAGDQSTFGITVELLMLSSASAIIGGLFIGSQSEGAGADCASKVGNWAGALVLELLAVVPFLAAVPGLFHELASSTLLHSKAAEGASTAAVSLGASELLPAVAILPFLVFELAGFGTLHFVVSKVANWLVNIGVLMLIVGAYIANREGAFGWEKGLSATLVVSMAILLVYGILKLKELQQLYDTGCPPKVEK